AIKLWEPTTIEDLPDEILLQMFEYLRGTPSTIRRIQLVSSRFRQITLMLFTTVHTFGLHLYTPKSTLYKRKAIISKYELQIFGDESRFDSIVKTTFVRCPQVKHLIFNIEHLTDNQ